MKTSPINAALSDLEQELESARSARRQIESAQTRVISASTAVWEEPEEAFGWVLNNIYETLLVVLEAADLPHTRQRVMDKVAAFEKDGGIGNTIYHPDYNYLESKPFEYAETAINNLRILTSKGLKPGHSYELAMLETILRRTPVLLKKREVYPQSEQDIKVVMQDYLEAYFIEYKRTVNISGVIRDFKPDGGVRNLKAAIEFKFASTQSELSRAIGGIFEDISGYSGSLDWTKFYSVIYQTEAFESEDRVRSELTRAGTVTWKALLVTGAGSRRGKSRKKSGST
jgi:hypothetical protein